MAKKPKNLLKRIEILAYIERYKRAWGFSPSLREIRENCSLSSTSTTAHFLRAMRGEGLISYVDSEARTIEIIGARWFPNDDAILAAAQQIQASRL